jgi:hypothetical protein
METMPKITTQALWVLLALAAVAPATAQQAVRLPARDVALQERPAAVFTVGTEEGRDWEMFSDIRTVAFDRSDNLYVLDGQNYRVVVFDARGRYVRHFGKRGGGPGELQAPLSLLINSDGNVVVNDIANRAFVVFKPTGEHVRNVPFPEELGFPGMVFGDGRGGLITRTMPRLVRQAGGSPPAPSTGPEFASIVRVPLQERATLTQLYRMPIPRAQQQDLPGGSGTERRRVAIRMDPVFGPGQLFTTLPDGSIAVQHESPFSVKVLDANGRALRTITREYPVQRVTQKDKEAWEERRNSGEGPPARTISVAMTGGGASSVSIGGASNRPAEAMRIELDDVPFADVMAVVTGMRSDPQGRLWIQRRHQNGTNQGPIDLVTAEGRYIGTLAPQALPDAVSASGLAAWIVRDDLGVERVSVRRLPASWR